MRKWLALALSTLAASCGGGDATNPDRVSARLSGEVFLDEDRHFEVEVFWIGPDGEEQLAGRTTAADGSFEVELGYRSGSFLVRATNDGQEQVLGYVQVGVDETARVFLTPVTHLLAVLAKRLEGDPAARVQKARALVSDHFLGLSHGELRPVDVRREPAVSLTDDVAAGFMLAAFQALARTWASGEAEAGAVQLVSAGRLLDALSADLSSDGTFDGLGERGRRITVAGRALDSQALRTDLGRALLRFAESDDNATAFGRAEVRLWRRRWRRAEAPSFWTARPSPSTTRGRCFGGGSLRGTGRASMRPGRSPGWSSWWWRWRTNRTWRGSSFRRRTTKSGMRGRRASSSTRPFFPKVPKRPSSSRRTCSGTGRAWWWRSTWTTRRRSSRWSRWTGSRPGT